MCGVGVAFLTPSVFVAVFSLVPAAERGSAAATVSIFIDLGLGGGPFVAGAIVGVAAIPEAFAFSGVAALVAAVAGLVVLSRRNAVAA